MRRYKITAGMYHNTDDGDYPDGEHIGTSVEYQWFDGCPTIADFPGWELEDTTDDGGIIIGKFDQEYDRSAEEYFGVYVSAIVELDQDSAEDEEE
jgi:hypothetical protein